MIASNEFEGQGYECITTNKFGSILSILRLFASISEHTFVEKIKKAIIAPMGWKRLHER